MIRYTLRCAEGHGFESWFKSGESYEALAAAGHVQCPDCGATKVEKSLMAPQVQPARRKAAAAPAEIRAEVSTGAPTGTPGPLTAPETERERALAELRAHVEANSDYVGMNFVAEARAMHEGLAPSRSIHGEARLDEAKKLIEDGVPVAPLPFLPRSRTN
jgi:hypothetical protein